MATFVLSELSRVPGAIRSFGTQERLNATLACVFFYVHSVENKIAGVPNQSLSAHPVEVVMTKKKNCRKIAVVDKKVQYSLAFRVVMHFFIFLCAGTILGLMNQFLMNPSGGAKENVSVFFRQNVPFLLAMLCLLPVFVRDTLTLSNRIAGPIYNLRTTISSILNDDPDVRPLKFRDGDYWTALPEEFNRMTDHLSGRQTPEPANHSEEKELVEV